MTAPRRSDSDLSKVNLQYDSSSGQVYSEAVVAARAGKSRRDSYTGSLSLPRLGKVRERLSFTGAPPSLETLAINSVFDNIESVTAEALLNVPWTLKKRLWDASKRLLNADQRFHLWRLLVQNGHRDSRLAYRRLSKESLRDEPLMPLPHYLPAINSPNCAWITALTISKLNIPRAHLYQLAQMPNLVALDICAVPDHDLGADDQPLIDDHVMKHFAVHADCAGAFQSLRVLILREFRTVTRECLQHLNSFLRLSLFGVQNCGIGRTSSALNADEKQAQQHGWTTEDERGLLRQLRYEIDMKRTWDGMLRACVEATAAFEQPQSSNGSGQRGTLWQNFSRRSSGVPRNRTVPLAFGADLDRSRSLIDDFPFTGVQNTMQPQNNGEPTQEQNVQPCADPPLLNFKMGPTCSGLIFPTPTIFFRCIHGHIQADDQATTGNKLIVDGADMQRSESKNRRPSGPYDAPPTKKPKLKAGRKIQVNSFLEMEGVGRSLSCVELKANQVG